jgi:CheY-like chemotaxis protein
MKPSPAPFERRRHTVLICDPCRDCANTTATLFSYLGCTAVPIYDACLLALTARQRRPTLIISELALKGTDGYRIPASLRSEGLLNSTLLVAMSGYCRASDRQRAAAAGFEAFLAKPASFRQFQEILALAECRLADSGQRQAS